MKKRHGFTAAAVLLVLCLAGCGNGAQEKQEDDQISVGYVETERKTPAIGTKGNLTEASDGSVFFSDAKGSVYQTKDGGENWEKVSQEAGIGTSYVIETALSEEGAFAYAVWNKSGDFAVYYPAGGKGLEPGMKTSGALSALDFGKDGVLYTAHEEGGVSSITVIDPQTGEGQLLTKTAGTVYQIAAYENRLYLRENERVEIYDLTAGEMQEEDLVLNEFAERYPENTGLTDEGARLCLLPEANGLYLGCEEGLFCYQPGEKEAVRLIDGDMSYFGKVDIRILGMSKVGEETYLVLFSDGKLRFFDCSGEGKQNYSHRLKVYSLQKNDAVRAAVENFRVEYPDVYVKYETGMVEGNSMTQQDALKNLNADLMAGNGPDVLIMDGLNVEAYREKGMLLDLAPLLEEVSGEISLLKNVTESQRLADGRIYVIPTRFQMPILEGKKEDLEKVGNLAELAELTKKIRERMPEGAITETYGARETLELLAMTSAFSWIKDDILQEDKVEEFLIQTKRIYEAEIAGMEEETRLKILESAKKFNGVEMENWTLGVLCKDNLFGKDEGILTGVVSEMHGSGLVSAYLNDRENMTIKVMPGQEGSYLFPAVQVGISSKTKERETAEAFVKTMLGKKAQQYDTEEGMAVNEDALDRMFEVVSGHYSYSVDGANGKAEELGFPSDEGMTLFKELARNTKCALPPDKQIMKAVSEYGAKVLEDQLSLEEGMSEIHKNVSIYLAE